jgi:uncharacterized protein
VVGGLPEAVATYAATRDFFEVARTQQGIVATYRDDFHKYSSGKQHELVRVVFDRLPTMVGKKFKYANGIPLAAEASASYFKTIYLDIGLMCAALKLSVLDLAKADLSMTNSGALAEQFIGQQIIPVEIKAGKSGTLKSLHQFLKEKKRHNALRFNADVPSLLDTTITPQNT